MTEQVSWPAALLLGGVALRVLLGVLTRRLLRVSARRARGRTERQLRARLAKLVEQQLVAPYTAEVAATARLREALEQLVSGHP